jgi:hypothetical protein
MSDKLNMRFELSTKDIPIIFIIIGVLLVFIFILIPWSYTYNKRIVGMIGIMFFSLGLTLYAINRFDKKSE